MAIKAKTSFSLKDQLFNAQSVGKLADALDNTQLHYKREEFEREILGAFPKLELKARIDWMVTVLAKHLPDNYGAALKILEDALPPPLDPKKTDDDFGEFIWTVPGEYAARYGCNDKHLKKSLAFLRKSTMRFSAENAIRPFLRDHPEKTMVFVRTWATDKNYHVRRLASEGIRPFLPWSERVDIEPKKIIEILELLKHDNTRYVTRSVANTFNDLSKIDAENVVATLSGWQKKPSEEMTWLTRHALRTLIKSGHGGALFLLGYPTDPDFNLSGIVVPKTVEVGNKLLYECSLTSNADQNLRIALCVHYLKANGTHSTKIFAVNDKKTRLGETIKISKKISFKPITTRTMYPGLHHVEVVVNGIKRGRKSFELCL